MAARGLLMSISATSGRRLMAGLIAASVLALTSPASAERRDAYDPQEAGHPVKIVYYVLYPIGFVLDVLILRPAYWLGQHEPFRTVFGVEAARFDDAGAAQDTEMPTTGAPDEVATD